MDEPQDQRLSERKRASLKVFVSYSREDAAFAQEIVAGLEMFGGFSVSIDTAAIHEGEDWQARLRTLIEAADTIVFILSPKSAVSSLCQWEVGEAERLSKRILPIQIASLNGIEAPPQLSALHYVRFDPQEDGELRSFMGGLALLRRALNTDIDWIREHTRLLVRAIEWEGAARAENRLLTGHDIAEAKSWLERGPTHGPKPTALHHDFISSSELAEEARVEIERDRVRELQIALVQAEAAQRATEISRVEEQKASHRVVQRTVAGLLASLFLATLASWFAWQSNLAKEEADRQSVRAANLARSEQAARKKAEIARLQATVEASNARTAAKRATREARRAEAAEIAATESAARAKTNAQIANTIARRLAGISEIQNQKSDAEFITKPSLVTDKKTGAIRLSAPLIFKDSLGHLWVVPGDIEISFAGQGLPLFLTSGYPVVKQFRRSLATILHDHYVKTKSKSWKTVHRMFFDALIALGADVVTAKTMYGAVFAFGPRWSNSNDSQKKIKPRKSK